jgi:transposase
VQEQFAEKFSETPVPHRNAVRRRFEKFRETGSVLDAERSGRSSKLNDKKLMDISDSMLLAILLFEVTVNSKRYCTMLHDFIGLLEEDDISYSWFQQDGATAH